MDFICQVQDGYMLARESKNNYILVNTGYPYPNTPQSNFEMLRTLILNEKGVSHSVEWYRDNYSGFKEYVMDCHKNGHIITLTDILNSMTYESRKHFPVTTPVAIYKLPKYEDILDLDGYLFLNPIYIKGIHMLHRVVSNGNLLGDIRKLEELVENNTSFMVFMYSDTTNSFGTLIDTCMDGFTELTDDIMESIEDLFSKINLTYKKFIAALGVMGIQQCLSRYYEFNDEGIDLLFDDLGFFGRNNTPIYDRISHISREFGKVEIAYLQRRQVCSDKIFIQFGKLR